MEACKNCLHYEICQMHYKQKCELTYETEREVRNAMRKAQKAVDIECDYYKDRSRFVELQTAHWIRHSPDKNIMRGFHKQGIGRGMGENSIFWTCSNCGNWGVLSYKYCPSCGAKIEKAEQALKEREKDE